MIEEPLYPIKNMHNWERELFQTKSVRRLKHLAHFGAGSYISPVVHSRFEHTVGVWKLAAHFFPEDSLIRAAAILHDIGHVPFSHSVERALGYNHHELTNQLIQEEAVSTVLQDAGLSSGEVCRYLNQSTPLTGVDGVMGIDHLDSFLRDTYMNGKAHFMPRNILLQLDCNERGIATDIETAEYLVELAYKDHVHFLSPMMVGVDRLLAEAVYREEKNDPKLRHVFPRLNDREVLARLKKSSDPDVLNIINTILDEPHKIRITEDNGYPIQVRKLYLNVPLVDGVLVTKSSKQARDYLKKMNELFFNKCVTIEG